MPGSYILAPNELVLLHADRVVDEFPCSDLRTLAFELEAEIEFYDDGRETCLMIATELRIRAAVGVRKWKGKQARRKV